MDRVIDEQVKDLVKKAREADKIDRERLELFEAMVKLPGWKVFIELLNSRVQLFADQVLAPAGSIDGAIGLEYVKGAMSGILIARDLLPITIAALSDLKPQPDDAATE